MVISAVSALVCVSRLLVSGWWRALRRKAAVLKWLLEGGLSLALLSLGTVSRSDVRAHSNHTSVNSVCRGVISMTTLLGVS